MKRIILLGALLACFIGFAQEDLLSELDADFELDSSTYAAFKGLKIVNLESTKLVAKRDFYFVIAHRFGSVKNGIKELFGLDQSTIRFSFIFGVSDWLNLGVSRSSYNKVYDFTGKYRLLVQEENGFPFTIVGFNSVAINTGFDEDDFLNYESKFRYTYLHEFLISRKFSDELSLQLAPIFIHENYVQNTEQENSQLALGIGGRYKLSKFVTFNMDYVHHMNRADNSSFKNPLSIGFDIETGGHVFQLHFTNAQPMYDSGFITDATGDWSDGDFFLGSIFPGFFRLVV